MFGELFVFGGGVFFFKALGQLFTQDNEDTAVILRKPRKGYTKISPMNLPFLQIELAKQDNTLSHTTRLK